MPSAFPYVIPDGVGGFQEAQSGMTLRDWFAGQALTGLLASGKWHNDGTGFEDFIAVHALNIADAMLRERGK